jgi:hypothetical protein
MAHTPSIVDYDALAAQMNSARSAEDRIRLPIDGQTMRTLLVRNIVLRVISTLAWTADAMAEAADAATTLLEHYPRPQSVPEPDMWSDPLLEDWAKVEPLCDCTLVVLMNGGAEDLLHEDRELIDALERLSTETTTRTGGRASAVLERIQMLGPVATPPAWWLSLDDDADAEHQDIGGAS